ncbi:hypothetical protein LGH70_21740 [Hymenobacter sp. BT635]|uniref:DUF2892 domain-containing protein n=1 Tax=Hymenobacter nitidus TaxID=2880929 RepID=A0ABS8AMK9_9BACT|nr:hypothetical protein [Hymenobacter nitidus]MCB2380229.1 hypothetical protein [Hymenobacter nitidus]
MSSHDPSRRSTSAATNAELDREARARVQACAQAGPAALDRRIEELDKEWDIDRTLMANASTLSLFGFAAGRTADRRWLVLPAVVSSFLLWHALQGWCPPLPIFRKLGYRSRKEIDAEKYALKALRGDFTGVDKQDAAQAWEAARR